MFVWTPRGPRPRFTISLRSVGQSRCVEDPHGTVLAAGAAGGALVDRLGEILEQLRGRPRPAPTSGALSPSVARRNSRNIRIFSGGEIAGLPVTSWTGQCFRHSPHWVQASISRSCLGESSSVKEQRFFIDVTYSSRHRSVVSRTWIWYRRLPSHRGFRERAPVAVLILPFGLMHQSRSFKSRFRASYMTSGAVKIWVGSSRTRTRNEHEVEHEQQALRSGAPARSS